MQLENLTARPHVDGNRIELAWTDPTPSPDVHIRRSRGSHPNGIDDGTEVADVRAGSATDKGLQGETVYYYTLFTRSAGEPAFTADPHNRVSAMATAGYGFGGQMFAMLPAIYRRYDAALTNPGGVEPADREKGMLRRFLDLPGAQLDQLYSLARAALDLHDLDRVDGRLLPLLAQWIGWRTDYRMPVRAQRREIRFAPEIYQRVGTFAAIDATARRVSGLRFQAKEFVHNIARTNEPERLNLWSVTRGDPATVWATPQLVSVNFVYEGRPAHVRDSDADLFVYHTRRRHGWDIWAKKRAPDGTWSASSPIVNRPGDDKHPAAARAGDRLWLFWETYDPNEPTPQRRRRIAFRTRPVNETAWSEISVSGQPDAEFIGADDAERRRPVVAVDSSGGLWLFWQELSRDRWEIRYNRHNGAQWQLPAPETLPQDDDSRIQDDLFLLAGPSSTDKRLWLFGARRAAVGPAGQSRWIITYRVKDGLEHANTLDWSAARTVREPSLDKHDREPAPLLGSGDRIELFFSTTQSTQAANRSHGGWSVFRAELHDPAANTWGSAEPVATGVASQRAPLAVRTPGATVLTYRSSEPLSHPDPSGGQAIDNRYAGTTTRRGTGPVTYGGLDDVQTYTYTTPEHGRRNDGRIARDVVGLFLVPPVPPDQTLPLQTALAISRLAKVAPEFLPINARAIFITRQ